MYLDAVHLTSYPHFLSPPSGIGEVPTDAVGQGLQTYIILKFVVDSLFLDFVLLTICAVLYPCYKICE